MFNLNREFPITSEYDLFRFLLDDSYSKLFDFCSEEFSFVVIYEKKSDRGTEYFWNYDIDNEICISNESELQTRLDEITKNMTYYMCSSFYDIEKYIEIEYCDWTLYFELEKFFSKYAIEDAKYAIERYPSQFTNYFNLNELFKDNLCGYDTANFYYHLFSIVPIFYWHDEDYSGRFCIIYNIENTYYMQYGSFGSCKNCDSTLYSSFGDRLDMLDYIARDIAYNTVSKEQIKNCNTKYWHPEHKKEFTTFLQTFIE